MGAFDSFDYKQVLKGAGKAVKGLVKTYSPESGAGIDEAGSGLGDILSSFGVKMDDEKPNTSEAKKFDSFGFAVNSRPERALPPPPVMQEQAPETELALQPESARELAPDASQESDRDVVAALLASRGWSPAEVENILAGPAAEQGPPPKPARRVVPQPAKRIAGSSGDTGVQDARPVLARYVAAVKE